MIRAVIGVVLVFGAIAFVDELAKCPTDHTMGDAAWREAARQVFQSRGTYDITDHATPEDLRCYLDREHCAVSWQEHAHNEQ